MRFLTNARSDESRQRRERIQFSASDDGKNTTFDAFCFHPSISSGTFARAVNRRLSSSIWIFLSFSSESFGFNFIKPKPDLMNAREERKAGEKKVDDVDTSTQKPENICYISQSTALQLEEATRWLSHRYYCYLLPETFSRRRKRFTNRKCIRKSSIRFYEVVNILLGLSRHHPRERKSLPSGSAPALISPFWCLRVFNYAKLIC